MTLSEMAVEYRKSAALCRDRLAKLNHDLRYGKMCEMDRLRLRRKALQLEAMLRDTAATAKYLENYYGDDNNEKTEFVCQAG